MIGRRQSLGLLVAAAGAATMSVPAAPMHMKKKITLCDVHAFGAKGDGVTPDTLAVQRAVDAAASIGGGRVLLRNGKKYLIAPVELKGGIDFHLEGTAEILVSPNPEDYASPVENGPSGPSAPRAIIGVLHARSARGLTISGTGAINGRSPDFMSSYDAENEWWVPKPFRPRLLVLEDCEDLTIRDVTLKQAPSWTIHMVGCRRVLIDHVSILNQLDVPNCDGIDPDHCQDVEIRNCHIVCGDDAVVIKTTAAFSAYGPSRNIHVHDCVLETQDSGLKIGTETTQDIHDVLFERCRIVQGSRGLCIQLRDQGNVYNVTFRDIRFVARYFAPPWWGRGEGISFTAIPRTPQTELGSIHDIRVEHVTGRAENSVRVNGHAASRIHDVTFDTVRLTFGRWTRYPGRVFDNRPTTALEPIEAHDTVGFSIRAADRVTLKGCEVHWDRALPDTFTHALEAEDVTALTHDGFAGTGAHPERDEAIVVPG